MKRGNSDKRWKQRAAPIAAAVLVIVFVLPLAAVGVPAALDLIQIGENLAALLFLLFYAVTGLAVASGCGNWTRGRKRMPKNTDQRTRRASAIRGALTGIAARLLAAAVLLWVRRNMPDGVLSTLLLALILVELGSIIPTIVVLKQRLNEIEGGEEDAAAQY